MAGFEPKMLFDVDASGDVSTLRILLGGEAGESVDLRPYDVAGDVVEAW